MKKAAYKAKIDRSRVVCVARVVGGLGLAELGELIADIGGPAGAGQLVHVVDYSAALIQIKRSDLLGVAGAVRARDGGEDIPAALIASRDQFDLFRDYAEIAGRNGVIAKVFMSADDAYRWASTQADVQRYWADCRRRQSLT